MNNTLKTEDEEGEEMSSLIEMMREHLADTLTRTVARLGPMPDATGDRVKGLTKGIE